MTRRPTAPVGQKGPPLLLTTGTASAALDADQKH
jgi:hypothetical protein